MRYREKLNIIFMRDNGPRHSIKLRRSTFILTCFAFLCMPILCIYLIAESWMLWRENVTFRDNIEKFEADFQRAEARAKRLENLETLLQEENVPDREILLRQLGSQVDPEAAEASASNNLEEENLEVADGPGHEEFPALDLGRVKVDNVQIRSLGNSLRIGLDLRNPDNEPILSGEVGATLITANGEKRPLHFSREETGSFRISKFKRTVMLAPLPKGAVADNAQVILEVKNQAGEPLYRNIFAVQH